MKTQTITLATLSLLLTAGTAFTADDVAAMKQLQAKEWTVPGIAMEMKLIPAGTFTMGSPEDEMARRDDEVQRKVTISKPFYMAAYETRQREYYKLMLPEDYNYNLWTYQRGPLWDGAAWRHKWRDGRQNAARNLDQYTHPIEMRTWDEAMEFCRTLTEQERKAGRLPEGYVYRLPTEAEWEYACRAGTAGPYNFEADYSKASELQPHMYLGGGTWFFGAGDTISGRKPNAWGLRDMHGNVYEWCLDWYWPYEEGPQTDPVALKTDSTDTPRIGKEKVARGGGCLGWVDDGVLNTHIHPFNRSAARYSFRPDANYVITLGFRVVLAPEVDGGGERADHP